MYLAHPLMDREYVRDRLEPYIENTLDVELVNPFYDRDYSRERIDVYDAGGVSYKTYATGLNARDIVEYAIENIRGCNGVLAVITNNPVVGTICEMFTAGYFFKKPVVVYMRDTRSKLRRIFDRVTGRVNNIDRFMYSPWFTYPSVIVTDRLNDVLYAIETLRDDYLSSRSGVNTIRRITIRRGE